MIEKKDLKKQMFNYILLFFQSVNSNFLVCLLSYIFSSTNEWWLLTLFYNNHKVNQSEMNENRCRAIRRNDKLRFIIWWQWLSWTNRLSFEYTVSNATTISNRYFYFYFFITKQKHNNLIFIHFVFTFFFTCFIRFGTFRYTSIALT